MKDLDQRARIQLGIELPPCYHRLLSHYGSRLAQDPVTERSWLPGLGNFDFAVGTTLSFRKLYPDLPKEFLIIGYAGKKLIAKINEEIDLYLFLDTTVETVGTIDSLGVWEKTGEHFGQWLAARLAQALLKLKENVHLIAATFAAQEDVTRFSRRLHDIQDRKRLEIEDLVYLERNADGRVTIHHDHPALFKAVTRGGVAGLLLGALILHPVLGSALGVATGALSSFGPNILNPAGLDDTFLRELSCTLEPATHALLAVVKSADPDRLEQEIQATGGTILIRGVTS